MDTTMAEVYAQKREQGLLWLSRSYIKVSLTIFCSNDTSMEVAEGGYDAEGEDHTSTGEEDTSLQVSIGFDIIYLE